MVQHIRGCLTTSTINKHSRHAGFASTSHLAIPPGSPETTRASLRGHFQGENPRRWGSAFTPSPSSATCVRRPLTLAGGPERTVRRFARDCSLSPSPSLYNIPATLGGVTEPVTSPCRGDVTVAIDPVGEADGTAPRACHRDVTVATSRHARIYERPARSAGAIVNNGEVIVTDKAFGLERRPDLLFFRGSYLTVSSFDKKYKTESVRTLLKFIHPYVKSMIRSRSR